MLNYAPDLILTTIVVLATLALQSFLDTKLRKISRNTYNSQNALKLRNRVKCILEDDRSFEVRKSYRMATKSEVLGEPSFLISKFNQ